MSTTAKLVLELATPRDLPVLHELLETVNLPQDGFSEHVDRTLVARADDEIVGSATLEVYGHSALLRSLAVAPSAQGQGLGRKLTHDILDLAQQWQIQRVYLLTETAADFFPKFGFSVITREEVDPAVKQSVEFRGACPLNATVMEKRMNTNTRETIHAQVREHYGKVALENSGCCSDGSCGSTLYVDQDLSFVPAEAVSSSRGCGNPQAIAALQPGEVVVDLGSGGGLDVLLAARQVGETGFVYGIDMTDEMLELARRNAARLNATNVEFRKGHLEDLPLADNTADVIISNCVVNLSPEKDNTLSETFRVLKPGGRLAISDIVVDGDLSGLPVSEAQIRAGLSWAGCIAGALTVDEFTSLLSAAGFKEISIEFDHHYQFSDFFGNMPETLASLPESILSDLVSRFGSASIKARK